LAVLDLLDDRGRAAGTWLALGGIFKGTSAVLLPLAVARRRWAALVVVAAVAVGSVAGSVAILGLEPFRVFAAEIAPTHSRSDGSPTSQSLAALLLRCTGRSQLPAAWNAGIALLQLAVFLALSLLVWTRRHLFATSPTLVAAAAAALLGCLLAFSPLVWAHYHLAGFLTLGWLLEEARRSHARALTALVPIVSLLFPLCLLAQADIPLPPEPVGSHLLVGSLFTIGMAWERLWRGARMGRSRRPTPARPRALATPAAYAPAASGSSAG